MAEAEAEGGGGAAHNPYLVELHAAMPRLLALFDVDPLSPTLGVGDRYFWAWKLIDFPNATFQGAAHGLARLYAAGLLPSELDGERVLERIEQMFTGTRAVTRADGSLEEALPHERSFCVTALVAFDLLSALELLDDALPSDARALETVRPLVTFLLRTEETHAFISNHLATAAAALLKWGRLTDDARARRRGREILGRILARQSAEGWFDEYGGADPGYQSLCTYYLADASRADDDASLREALERSIEFLWHFAHPDGSFGGLYGSRNTRFYYPAGVEHLARADPRAAALAAFMRRSVASRSTVTLAAMDEPNLVPMLNCYAWAATLVAAGDEPPRALPAVPCLAAAPARRHFPEAGLVVDRGPGHYTVVSTHKGGVTCHFADGRAPLVDAGAVARDPRGRVHTTQGYDADNVASLDDDRLEIVAPMRPLSHPLPGPVKFVALRLAALTLFRVPLLADWIKRALVRYLITRRGSSPATNERSIALGADLIVTDRLRAPPGWREVPSGRPFSVIHMASQGYWQRQDDAPRRGSEH